MKRIVTLLIFLCGLAAPMAAWAEQRPAPAIGWLDFEEAQKQGQDQSRKFLLYFFTDWCGYCRKLEQSTFSDKSVVDYINRNFIPVRINSEKLPKIAGRYGVSGVPDIRFLTPTGENIARWPGYIEAPKLLPMLKYIHSDSYQKMGYTEFLKTQ
ncbi:MAG: thioredoxin fold domain-containing protein [Desulfatitalea sp.]